MNRNWKKNTSECKIVFLLIYFQGIKIIKLKLSIKVQKEIIILIKKK